MRVNWRNIHVLGAVWISFDVEKAANIRHDTRRLLLKAKGTRFNSGVQKVESSRSSLIKLFMYNFHVLK